MKEALVWETEEEMDLALAERVRNLRKRGDVYIQPGEPGEGQPIG